MPVERIPFTWRSLRWIGGNRGGRAAAAILCLQKRGSWDTDRVVVHLHVNGLETAKTFETVQSEGKGNHEFATFHGKNVNVSQERTAARNMGQFAQSEMNQMRKKEVDRGTPPQSALQ